MPPSTNSFDLFAIERLRSGIEASCKGACQTVAIWRDLGLYPVGGFLLLRFLYLCFNILSKIPSSKSPISITTEDFFFFLTSPDQLTLAAAPWFRNRSLVVESAPTQPPNAYDFINIYVIGLGTTSQDQGIPRESPEVGRDGQSGREEGGNQIYGFSLRIEGFTYRDWEESRKIYFVELLNAICEVWRHPNERSLTSLSVGQFACFTTKTKNSKTQLDFVCKQNFPQWNTSLSDVWWAQFCCKVNVPKIG